VVLKSLGQAGGNQRRPPKPSGAHATARPNPKAAQATPADAPEKPPGYSKFQFGLHDLQILG